MKRSEKAKSLRKTLCDLLYLNIFRHEKLVVIEKILADTSIKTETKIEVDFKLVQPNDFPEFTNKFKKTHFPIDAEEFSKSGDMCIVAEARGEIVNCIWVSLNENYVTEIEKKIRMPNSHSAYTYAANTDSEYRGLGIAPRAMEELFNYLHERGIKRVFGLVRLSNFPALRYTQKAGFRKIGMIEYVGILKLRLYVCKGETEKDYNTLIEMLSTGEDRSKLQLIC